jgi:hypothetical protein
VESDVSAHRCVAGTARDSTSATRSTSCGASIARQSLVSAAGRTAGISQARHRPVVGLSCCGPRGPTRRGRVPAAREEPSVV